MDQKKANTCQMWLATWHRQKNQNGIKWDSKLGKVTEVEADGQMLVGLCSEIIYEFVLRFQLTEDYQQGLPQG
jgi:hypothetical protein